MKVIFPCFDKNNNLLQTRLEVQTVTGLPELKILGINGQEAQTLKEKLRTSLKSQHMKLKNLRKVIHFKEIDSKNVNLDQFDLQLAAMLLSKFKILNFPNKLSLYFIGKLDLDGKVITSISDSQLQLLCAKMPKVIFITSNYSQLNDPNLIKIEQLSDLLKIDYFKLIPVPKAQLLPIDESNSKDEVTLDNIQEFQAAKLALVLTLKSSGSLLLIGSSGAGKSMLFRSLPSLGVPQDNITYLDSSYSVQNFKNLISSLNRSAVDSLNTNPQILILNELNDYKKSFLDYLKLFFDDLEAKRFEFPFIVLASLNPCPCGNHGHSEKLCFCNPFQIKRFENKVPFPVLDRFDLVLNLNKTPENFYPQITMSEALAYLNSDLANSIPLDKFAEYLMTVLKTEFAPSMRRCNKINETAKLIALKKHEPVLSEESMSEAIFLNTYLLQKNVSIK